MKEKKDHKREKLLLCTVLDDMTIQLPKAVIKKLKLVPGDQINLSVSDSILKLELHDENKAFLDRTMALVKRASDDLENRLDEAYKTLERLQAKQKN